MPWANTATFLIRRDWLPSLSTRGCSSRTRSRTRSQVSSGRYGTAAMSLSPCRTSASRSCANPGVSFAGTPLTTQPTTRGCSPAEYRSAVMASLSARLSAARGSGSGPGLGIGSAWCPPATASAAGQLAASRTSASSALASDSLSSLAYSSSGTGLSPSTTTTSY